MLTAGPPGVIPASLSTNALNSPSIALYCVVAYLPAEPGSHTLRTTLIGMVRASAAACRAMAGRFGPNGFPIPGRVFDGTLTGGDAFGVPEKKFRIPATPFDTHLPANCAPRLTAAPARRA